MCEVTQTSGRGMIDANLWNMELFLWCDPVGPRAADVEQETGPSGQRTDPTRWSEQTAEETVTDDEVASKTRLRKRLGAADTEGGF